MMKDPCRWKLHKVPEVESHSEYLSSVLTWKKLFITNDESETPSWAKLTVQSVEKSKIQWASVRKHQRIGVFHQVRLRHQTFSNFFRVIFSYFLIRWYFDWSCFIVLTSQSFNLTWIALVIKYQRPSIFMSSKIADPVDMSNTENSCSNKPW